MTLNRVNLPGLRIQTPEPQVKTPGLQVETLGRIHETLWLRIMNNGFRRKQEVFICDCYPASRDAQIHLVEAWLSVFQTKATAWNIPPANVTDLTADKAAAREILAVVKSGERTAASVVRCNEAFREMESEARFIKKHFLLIPPLTLADLPTLLIPLPDETYSPVSPPTVQPGITVTYPGGPHLLKVHLTAIVGAEPLDARSDYGYTL
ncbi:MAG: hypothetical protein LBK73_03060 [Treponema sp.]|jgi:hypothetical protein|nr:hypothetical protein [Treponema sp.]